MKLQVAKWGNSLAIRIPKAFAEEAGLETDSEVEITLDAGRLVIAPRRKPKYTLEELLAQVTDENIHDEIDTGPAVGNEAW